MLLIRWVGSQKLLLTILLIASVFAVGALAWFVFFKDNPKAIPPSRVVTAPSSAKMSGPAIKSTSLAGALVPGTVEKLRANDASGLPNQVAVTATVDIISQTAENFLVVKVPTNDGKEYPVKIDLTSPDGRILLHPSEVLSGSGPVEVKAMPVGEILSSLKIGQPIKLLFTVDANMDRFAKSEKCSEKCRAIIALAKKYYQQNMNVVNVLQGKGDGNNLTVGAVGTIEL